MYIKEKDFKLSLLFPRNSSWYFNYYIIVKSLHCCVQMILIILSTLFNFVHSNRMSKCQRLMRKIVTLYAVGYMQCNVMLEA